MTTRQKALFCLLFVFSVPAYAYADFEGTLSNLVNAIIGRILPIFALGYVAKNIYGHIQNRPEATAESLRLAVAVVSLFGIRAVWAFLQAQVR